MGRLVPRKKKPTFTPKKKKTIVPEPKWEKLCKAKTEEEKVDAWHKCDEFVHFEVTDKEQLHAMRRWIELQSNWDLVVESKTIPDNYLLSFAKNGWKARRLGYMPESVYVSLTKNLKPLVVRAQDLKDKMTTESPIDPTLDKNYFLHPDKVKNWMKKWQGFLKSSKNWQESKDPSLRMQYQIAQTYVYNMGLYLRNGVWSDSHWGEDRQHRVLHVCKALAYDENGVVKRSVGTYYPDIGTVWKGEQDADR